MILITPLPGVTTTKPGSATKPFPGVDAGVFDERGNEVGPGGGGYLVLKRPWPSMLRGIFSDDDALPRDVLVEVRERLLRGRRRAHRPRRRLLAARPRRRRDERVRAPHLDDRGRVGARRPPRRRGGRGLLAQGRDDGRGDRRLRDAEGRAPRRRSRSSPSCATTSRRRSARSRSRRTSSSRRSCRRRGAARSCAASCATSPRTGRSATRRRSPTRPSCRRSRSGRPRRGGRRCVSEAARPHLMDREDATQTRSRLLQRDLDVDREAGPHAGRRRRDGALRARVRVSLACSRHGGEPCSQRVAVLARLRHPRPPRAGAPVRAPLSRARRRLAGEMEEFDLPAAYEALARAHGSPATRREPPLRRARPRRDGEDRGRGRPQAHGSRLRDDQAVTRVGAIRVEWLDRHVDERTPSG